MWIPLGARWDQEPAGSLVVPTPQKIAGSVAGERGGKGGEEKGGEIGLRLAPLPPPTPLFYPPFDIP
mgnify:CR=1 FL=1